ANFIMPLCGHAKITAERLFYFHGQGDTRARPAAALNVAVKQTEPIKLITERGSYEREGNCGNPPPV
ncbi:hypothetical protein, partial [Anaerotruncus colihominis]